MLKLVVLLSCAVAVLGAPPVSKSQEDIQGFRNYLEQAKINNGRTLEEAMAENPEAKAWENSGKYQGDILLNEDQIQNMVDSYSDTAPSERSTLIWPQVRWPSNTIIWDFAAGHLTQNQRNQVIAAYQDIERNTCIRFQQRTNQANFVSVTNHQDGCYAHVGYWVGFGVHTLNLADGCFHHLIIIHEWLHVVGQMHMHQNYQRYNYVTINWHNMVQGMEYAFELNPNNEVTMLGTPYEYTSNMHYDRWAFSFNGQPTMLPRFNDNNQMGQLQFVTGWDWARANRAYNCPGAWDDGMHEGELAEGMAQPNEDQPLDLNPGEVILAVMDAPQEENVKIVDAPVSNDN